MALFKPLLGDESRISLEITPFHEGYVYFVKEGFLYFDVNLGTEEEPNNQRIKLNASDAETLLGASLATILNSSDIEIPTSKAVLDALSEKVNVSDLPDFSEVQMSSNRFNSNVSWNDDETVYTETWSYNGDNYKKVMTIISDTEYTIQLTINDVNAGLWTTVINETNKVSSTTYTAQ